MSIAVRWVIGATLMIACAMGIGRFAYTPLLPLMVAEFGWDFAAAGDVASANFLGYMVGAMLAPRLANSPQARTWVAFSLMASVLTTYLGAEATTFAQWLTVRFLSGIASAFCLVTVTTHLIYRLAADGREGLGNVHFAGVGVGILACMAAVYMDGDTSAQWARLGGLAAVLMAIAWMLFSRGAWHTPDPVAAPQDGGGFRGLGRLIAGYGFFGFGYVVAATFLVAMAESTAQDGFRTGDVWLIVGLAVLPSVYLWQMVANRVGILDALRAAYVVEGAGLLLAGVSDGFLALALASAILGGTFAAITALGISAARSAAPHRVAFAVSAMTVSFALGQLLGPAFAGRMADYSGGFFWPSLAAALLLLGAALLVPRRAPG